MHPDKFLASLPPELRATAIPLSTDGTIAGVAWSAPDFAKVVDEFRHNRLAILGGDVIIVEQGVPRYSYDSWHTEHKLKEPYDDFVTRSILATLQYLERYPDPMDGTIAYAPTVIDSKELMSFIAVEWSQFGVNITSRSRMSRFLRWLGGA